MGSLEVTTCLLVAWGLSSGSDYGSVDGYNCGSVAAWLPVSLSLSLSLPVPLSMCLTDQANNATETTKTKCL